MVTEKNKLLELREFLTQCIYDIKSYNLSVKKANEIAKMGAVVCQTYYLEKNYLRAEIIKKIKNRY